MKNPYLGWLVALLIGAAWWWSSRPDPEALHRANVWQAHAESLAARQSRDRVTFTDTVKVYVRGVASARARTDSVLGHVPRDTIVSHPGPWCDSLGIRYAFADSLRPLLAAERDWADSSLAFLNRRILQQNNTITDYQELADSLRFDLGKALGRGRGFGLAPCVGVMAGSGGLGVGVGVCLRF